ncbi:MAG: heme o synthase, partial [Acidobacteriota bacterium]|nr:heme o synthase [Acidobacteriota bacterium]
MSVSHSQPSSPAEAGHHIAQVKATPSRAADFVTLTKPRLNFLVLLTTAAAYSLGAGPGATLAAFAHTLLGTFLVAGGASALNQAWERDTDRLMRRTRMRPIADLRMPPSAGIIFGLSLTVLGATELAYFLNPLTASVALFTAISYVLFYTPLKTRTSLSTIVGALPGALPAVIGWAAATNTLSIEGWVLFGIVFMWQMPHFLAIAWMYRDEYARAG